MKITLDRIVKLWFTTFFICVILWMAALIAFAGDVKAGYNFKPVHGYNGNGHSQPSGFYVVATDYDWPNYPIAYLYVQSQRDDAQIVAAYFEGLPAEIIGAGMDVTAPPFHDWSSWDAPAFPLANALDFHPTLAWTGDPLPKWIIRLWIFQGLFPCNDAIQNGTLRIGILVRDSKGRIEAYLNEVAPVEVPATPRPPR